MSSILDISIDIKVDKNYLKKNKFWPRTFGNSLNTVYKNGRPTTAFHKNQTFYVRYIDTNHYYTGSIYYFPKNFIGTTPIPVCKHQISGYAYAVINEVPSGEQKYECIYIDSAADMEMIMHLLNKELEDLNKNTWSYWSEK